MNTKKLMFLYPLKKEELAQQLQDRSAAPVSAVHDLKIHRRFFLVKLNDNELQSLQKKYDRPDTAPAPAPQAKSMLFKCKICGSTVSTDGSSKIYTCKKCRSVQPIPDYCSQHVSFLYGRANHYFRTKRFETALHLFQQIAAESPNDCEAYRSIVLSRYGVSYDEENGIYSKEPRINIVRSESILNDPDYLTAVSLADNERRSLYIKEAQRIEIINQEILETAQTVPSFDAVIEYRGHDSKNRYTPEKAMAEELYRQLGECGFRVYNRQIKAGKRTEKAKDHRFSQQEKMTPC